MSNLDFLANELFLDLENDNDCFRTKYVITSSNTMQSFLKMYYLKNNDKVLMNVSFLNMQSGLLSLFKTTKKLISKNQMIALILKYLNFNEVEELKDYLDKASGSYNARLYGIAKELANLFNDYDNDLLEYNGYQKDIYDYVIDMANNENLTTLRYLLDNASMLNIGIIYFFGEIKYSKLEEAIINKYKNFKKYTLKKENKKTNKLEIIKAPNKQKEIENIHSKICQILLTEDVTFSDFLVVGTNLVEYESVINRVFSQDDKEFPNIPYYVGVSKAKKNNTYNALNILKDIINKGFFTRLDFVNLINNYSIKMTRDILDIDINNWQQSIINMNIYRKDDWDYCKKRLLISKFVDINSDNNTIILNDDKYLPFSRIGLDDESITRLISLIDDIYYFMDVINKYDGNNTKLKEALDRFLSIKDFNEIETNGYYKMVVDILEFLDKINANDLPSQIVLDLLIDSSNRNVGNIGEVYSSGVSFVEFDPKVILSAKYVFFINASSANLPQKKFPNALDINSHVNYDDEKYAFELYFQNAEHFYVSYIYKDLKTGEEFFLSHFVKDLNDKFIDNIVSLDSKKNFEEKYLPYLSLDEDRKWDEIFTKSAMKNKDFYNHLLDETIDDDIEIDMTQIVEPNIKSNDLADFLFEPLSAKVNQLFTKNDELQKNLIKEYEPFELDDINNALIFREVVKDLLKDEYRNQKLDIDTLDLNKLKENYHLEHTLPRVSNIIENVTFNNLVLKAIEFKEFVEKLGNYEIISKLDDLSINEYILKDNTQYVKIINNNERTYIPIKEIKEIKEIDLLRVYIISLMDVASLESDSCYNITLLPVNKNASKYEFPFSLTKEKAISLLEEMTKDYKDYQNVKYFPFDFNKEDYIDLVDGFNQGHFDYKKLFDRFNGLGYRENRFIDELKIMLEKKHKLVLFLKEEE